MKLRPYQDEAVEAILERGNLLLAMTMGSGKTAVAIVSIRRLRRERRVDHGVVFCPKSTMGQWLREIKRWDPRASVQLVTGEKFGRRRQWHRSHQYHYTIATTDALTYDWDEIRQHAAIDFVIIDEVTSIKGFTAKRAKHAKALAKHTEVRIGLSGQPVENRPEELFSIMEFIDREVLGGFSKFDRTFIVRDHWGKPKKYRNLGVLQKVMQGSMFRRSREDIAEWLPERIETEMPIELEPALMKLHDLVRADLSEAIDSAIAGGARGSFDVLAHYGKVESNMGISLMGQVMSRLLAMRMLSSHPALLRISADEFDTQVSKRGSEYASLLAANGHLDNLPILTDKVQALVDTVNEILTEDPRHKVVVFSYFKPMMGIFRRHLNWDGVGINGDTSTQERTNRIQRFNEDPACRMFYSTDAGAYGVDLNQGSHLICYDLPWSAGALAQRISRIDRTNSAFPSIQIIYMYGQDTIEERMYLMLQQKLKVARAFLDGEFDAKSGTISLDLQSLREFLDS
jgi:SNF2 family DNA or RNA helicase